MIAITGETTLGELREILLAQQIAPLTFGIVNGAGGGRYYVAHVMPFDARDIRETAATPWEALAEALRKSESWRQTAESR